MNQNAYIKRPQKTHGIDDMARTAIENICSKKGWSTEVVVQDYGEDLLVQTAYQEKIDHFKVWLQVKGTKDIETYRKADGKIKFQLSYAHIFKWIRSLDNCYVVLWDTTNDFGLYFSPKTDLDELDVYTKTTASITITFNEENIISQESLHKLEWESRINHFYSIIAQAKYEMLNTLSSEKEHYQKLFHIKILHFLSFINILDIDEYVTFNESYLVSYRKWLAIHTANEPDEEYKILMETAGLTALIYYLNDICDDCKIGLPSSLIDDIRDFLFNSEFLLEEYKNSIAYIKQIRNSPNIRQYLTEMQNIIMGADV